MNEQVLLKASHPCAGHEQSDTQHVAQDLAGDGPITLQVGERRFVTNPTTLTGESPYFARMLSAQWRRAQADGSYFVDADGDLFAHILRYLRSGTLPFFYEKSRGHDYSKYHMLLAEAEYFGIEGLKDWLKNNKYEYALTVHHYVRTVRDIDDLHKTRTADCELEYHPTWKTRKVYICPQKIDDHRGDPSACTRRCKKIQGDAADEYEEEEYPEILVIQRSISLDNRYFLEHNDTGDSDMEES